MYLCPVVPNKSNIVPTMTAMTDIAIETNISVFLGREYRLSFDTQKTSWYKERLYTDVYDLSELVHDIQLKYIGQSVATGGPAYTAHNPIIGANLKDGSIDGNEGGVCAIHMGHGIMTLDFYMMKYFLMDTAKLRYEHDITTSDAYKSYHRTHDFTSGADLQDIVDKEYSDIGHYNGIGLQMRSSEIVLVSYAYYPVLNCTMVCHLAYMHGTVADLLKVYKPMEDTTKDIMDRLLNTVTSCGDNIPVQSI